MKNFTWKPRRSILALAVLSATGAVFAEGQTHHINIAPQSVSDALKTLASETHIQIFSDGEALKGKKTNGIQGDFTAKEALQKLLAGTGLSYTFTADDAVAVKAADLGIDASILPAVDVTGRAQLDPTDPYNSDYNRPNASMATKTETSIKETPFSVQVVPQQVLQDQQAITLQDVTKNVSGVQTNFGYENLYQAFAIRGFETNTTLRNGQRAGGGYGRTMFEMANIDSVEVLKGPAAMLYGRLDPGGMVNVVTKKPLDREYYSLQQQFGSFDLFRTTIDATGPLDSDKTVLYRMNYSYFASDSFQTKAPNSTSHFLAPSLTWRPNDRFEANINIEFKDANPLNSAGIPAIGNKPANIPITTYIGGTSSNKVNVDHKLVDFKWTYKLNDSWKISNGLSATFDDMSFKQLYTTGTNPYFQPLDLRIQPNVGLEPWFVNRTSQGYNSFLDLNGEFKIFGIEHKLLFGTDHYLLDYSDIGFNHGWSSIATQNIYNPSLITYASGWSFATAGQQNPDWTSVSTAQWNGVYLQDQMKILDKVHLNLGGRYDRVQSNGGQITLEYAPPGSTLNGVARSTTNDEKFSPRAGLVYDALPWLSIYGNYVESLGNAGAYGSVTLDANGVPLHASRSYSYEGGFKIEAFEKRLLSTISFYEINKTNMATRDITSPNPNVMTNTGAARSRGVEFDIAGSITNDLSLIGSYAYTDARFTTNNDGLQGNLLANVPRNSGSIWAKYQLIPEKMFIGLGGNFRGTRQGDNQNSFLLPGYATLDAYLAYKFNFAGKTKLTTQLNVNNILDKAYYINSNVYDAVPSLAIMPGQPLSVMGSLKLEF